MIFVNEQGYGKIVGLPVFESVVKLIVETPEISASSDLRKKRTEVLE